LWWVSRLRGGTRWPASTCQVPRTWQPDNLRSCWQTSSERVGLEAGLPVGDLASCAARETQGSHPGLVSTGPSALACLSGRRCACVPRQNGRSTEG
jgi:hypothetical protein